MDNNTERESRERLKKIFEDKILEAQKSGDVELTQVYSKLLSDLLIGDK